MFHVIAEAKWYILHVLGLVTLDLKYCYVCYLAVCYRTLVGKLHKCSFCVVMQCENVLRMLGLYNRCSILRGTWLEYLWPMVNICQKYAIFGKRNKEGEKLFQLSF